MQTTNPNHTCVAGLCSEAGQPRPTSATLQSRAAVCKALGHPSRMAMVDALTSGERCVCELQELVGADMSTVSKHLSLLRQAGVVEADKRGANVYYRLALPCVGGFLGCLDGVLRELARTELAQLAGEAPA